MAEDRDRHICRSGDDYATAYLSLLPQGQAWPKEPGSILERTCNGLMQYWGYVDGRACKLLEIESDPQLTTDAPDPNDPGNPEKNDGLLPEWERAWGLPDECFFGIGQTLEDRRRLLLLKMRWLGDQSRAYFIDVLDKLGYKDVVIKEFSPFMAGISRVGDTRQPPPSSPISAQHYRWYIGPAEQRFVWSVSFEQVKLDWFRAGSSQAGVHHHLEFVQPDAAVCLLEKWKPAHTVIVPDYTNLSNGGPMQGTP